MAIPLFPFEIDWSSAAAKRWNFDPREATIGFGPEFLDLTQTEVIRGWDFAVYLPDAQAIRRWETWWQQRVTLGQIFALRDPRQNDADNVTVNVRLAGEKLAFQWLASNRAIGKIRVIELPFESVADVEEEPLWLYEFTDGGTSLRFTSHQVNVAYLNRAYTAASITHGSIREALDGDKNECSITTAFFAGNPLASRVPFASAAPLSISISRWSRQPEYAEVVFSGRVGAVSLEGNVLKAKCTTERALFASQVPQFYVQERCNHLLYGRACGVARSPNWDYYATISVINRGHVTVTGGVIANQPQGWFAQGYCTAAGEAMAIVASEGATLFLAGPLRQAQVGDQIIAYAGCSKASAVCISKFNNFARFGGHPKVPRENLTLKALDYDANTPAGGK